MNYFSEEIFEGEMAHARFFEENVRERMPKCSYRKYTISEIINSVINSGDVYKRQVQYQVRVSAGTNFNVQLKKNTDMSYKNWFDFSSGLAVAEPARTELELSLIHI